MEKRITTQDKNKLGALNRFRHNLSKKALLNKTYDKPLYNKEHDELIQLNADNNAVYRSGVVKLFGKNIGIGISGEKYNELKTKLLAKELPTFIEIDGKIIASRAIESVEPALYTDKKSNLENLEEEFKDYQEVKDIKDL